MKSVFFIVVKKGLSITNVSVKVKPRAPENTVEPLISDAINAKI